jgi:hypothetical protein
MQSIEGDRLPNAARCGRSLGPPLLDRRNVVWSDGAEDYSRTGE